MSGIDTKAVVSELAEKLPLWIDKVYQFDSRTLGIRLNGEEKARYLFLIESGRRAHLVSSLPEPPKNPPQFAMFLRKHLAGGKVLAVRQHGLERIIIFDIGKGNQLYRLIIELFDEGNVILADEHYTIVKPLRHHRFKDRDIIPGVLYQLAPCDPTGSEDALRSMLANDSRDLVRALAMGAMLGGSYAEYVCRQAGIEKSLPAKDADASGIWQVISGLFHKVLCERSPVVSDKHCEPVDLSGTGGLKHFPDFSSALEAFYPLTKKETEKKAAGPKLSREERILKHQQAAIRRFDEQIAKNQELVNTIYENYQFVGKLIESLDTASRQLSWQEMERHLRGMSSPEARKIVAFHPEDAAVDVDIGNIVRIHVHDGVEQNAGRYYDIIKKFRKKKEGALAAMKKPVAKKKELRREIVPMKKLWYHRFRWFVTSDGVVVLGGRDASQNEELVKKYMAGGDLFLHADVHGASVVIVKGKTEHMDEVTRFAASYSGAWRSGLGSADVFSAHPSQVSKTPETGEFVSRGSFIVRGERTWYRNVPLSVGIGLMLEPHAAVIGGPPAAIRGRVKVFVELVPGQFEPNDAAKKVLRILKAGVSPEEEKALRNVLNTEHVAAFVPPGGSDIPGHHES